MTDLTNDVADISDQQVQNSQTSTDIEWWNPISNSDGKSTLQDGSVTLVDWKVLDPKNYLLYLLFCFLYLFHCYLFLPPWY